MKKKQNETTNVSTTRFIFSIIDFIENNVNVNTVISSYVINNNSINASDNTFATNNICDFILEHNKSIINDNRIFLVVLLDLKRPLLQQILCQLDKSFLDSDIIKLLSSYEPNSKVNVISNSTCKELKNFMVIVFNLPNKSSIEVVISSIKLKSNLLDVDLNGNIVEYHKKLHENIRLFDLARKK